MKTFWGVAFGQQPILSLLRSEALCGVTPREKLTLVAAHIPRAIVPGETHEALTVLAGRGGPEGHSLFSPIKVADTPLGMVFKKAALPLAPWRCGQDNVAHETS